MGGCMIIKPVFRQKTYLYHNLIFKNVLLNQILYLTANYEHVSEPVLQCDLPCIICT